MSTVSNKTCVQKNLIEQYRQYAIYIISGVSPVLFLAEKENASMGPTMSARSLKTLHKNIDDMLSYAASVNIKTFDCSQILKNPRALRRATASECEEFTIIIEANFDINVVVQMVENKPIRKSKKHKKTRKDVHTIKIALQNKVHERRK